MAGSGQSLGALGENEGEGFGWVLQLESRRRVRPKHDDNGHLDSGAALRPSRSGSSIHSNLRSLSQLRRFRWKKFLDFDTVVFSFLFDKYYLIIE